MKRQENRRVGRSQGRLRPHGAMRTLCETRSTLMTTQQISVSGLRQAERLQISLEDILIALGYKRELVQMLANDRPNR